MLLGAVGRRKTGSLVVQEEVAVTPIIRAWRVRGELILYHHREIYLMCHKISAVVDSLSKWQWEILVSSLWMSCDQSCGPFTANQISYKSLHDPFFLSKTSFWFFGCNIKKVHYRYSWFVQGQPDSVYLYVSIMIQICFVY